MPSSNQLLTWDLIQTEVTAGTMYWAGSAQSGNQIADWTAFTTYVLNDGTNPNSYASNKCPPYSEMLLRKITPTPTSVSLGSGNDCSICQYAVNGSWAGRPSGWDAMVSLSNGVFSNVGQVDSYQWLVSPNTAYTFRVKFTNGTGTGPTSTASNSINTGHCGGCP